MLKFKWLIAGFAAGVLVAAAPSCGGGGTAKCNASTCPQGCCDTAGKCQTPSNGACGQLGNTCQVCAIGQICNLGTCIGGSGGGTGMGGGTGGGAMGGGTGGGGAMGGGTGGGGGPTGGGGGTTCTGCFAGTVCVMPPSNATDSFCGTNGQACAQCNTGAGQACVNFQCVGGTGGGTGGGVGGGVGGGTGGGGGVVQVGSPCTNSTQCTALGSGAYCKLQTTPWPGYAATPYPTGFCTLPCPTGTCAGGNVCAGGASTYPYLFNETDRFCTTPCTSTCPLTGFGCIAVTDLFGASPQRGCWIYSSTNPNLPPFTGGGAPNKSGQACTTDTQCANPPDPSLAICATAAQGFPNGLCLASSDLAPADSWCFSGGGVEVGLPRSDGGTAYYCTGTCPNPAGGFAVARTGYSCFSVTRPDGGLAGALWPSCTGPTDCGGSVPYCNPATGYCCTMAGGQCADSF